MSFEQRLAELDNVRRLRSLATSLAVAKTADFVAIPLQDRRGIPDPMTDPEVVAAFRAYDRADREVAGQTSSFDYAPDDLV